MNEELFANAVCLAPMVRSVRDHTLQQAMLCEAEGGWMDCRGPCRCAFCRCGTAPTSCTAKRSSTSASRPLRASRTVRALMAAPIGCRYMDTERAVSLDVLKTVDFMSRNGESVVFRTCAEERGKVVFQIGTADAVLALKAAEHVYVLQLCLESLGGV